MNVTHPRYKETLRQFTSENGLRCILVFKPDYQGSCALLGTPFGALDLEQVDQDGTIYHVIPGTAHFLEHKLFENPEGDIMNVFTDLGAQVNAFTSYNETVYYFTTSADVIEPLNVLMDFVANPSISEASVEKEKGIIVQELNMYEQMPDVRLMMETYKSLYHNHPLKFDIGGDEQSVLSVSKDHLDECYLRNYHPQQMVLVVATGVDLDVIEETIRKKQSEHPVRSMQKVVRASVNEPKEVVNTYHAITMDVQSEKVAVAFKITEFFDSPLKRLKAEWAMRFLSEAAFSSLNPEYQQWMDDEIITDFFGVDSDFGEDYGFVLFFNETSNPKQFEDFVLEQWEKATISEATLQQLKRRSLGSAIRRMNHLDDLALGIMRSTFEQMDYFDTIDVIETISLDEVLAIKPLVHVENRSVITLSKKA